MLCLSFFYHHQSKNYVWTGNTTVFLCHTELLNKYEKIGEYCNTSARNKINYTDMNQRNERQMNVMFFTAKKWSFSLGISLVSVTKSAGIFNLKSLMQNLLFCAMFICQIILLLKSISQENAVFWSDFSALSQLLEFLVN